MRDGMPVQCFEKFEDFSMQRLQCLILYLIHSGDLPDGELTIHP